MTPALPKPIAAYVEANARLDVNGMLKPFAADAVLLDNGKRHEGHAELRTLLEVQMPAKIRRRMTLSGGSAEGDTRGRRDSWKKRGAGESRWRLHTSALAVDV